MREIFSFEPAESYHQRSRNGEFMASHMLEKFRESPALYHKVITGEAPECETPAFSLGRAAHTLILESRSAFERNYIVSDGPVNPKTGEVFGKNTKSYAEWKLRLDREVISARDYGFIEKLKNSVFSHPFAAKLLKDGVPEGVLRAEYCQVPCQIRMDYFSPEYGIVDLKTCESLKWFESDCRRYGYIFQLAFYRAITKAVTGADLPVYIVAVEKKEPFSAGVWKLTSLVLGQAEKINQKALARYLECRKSGVWPTNYEEVRIIDNI